MKAMMLANLYWRYPWTFKANGDWHIHKFNGVTVIKQADYLPKSQWVQT